MNRRDWRTVSTGDVKVDVNEVQTALVPMLRFIRQHPGLHWKAQNVGQPFGLRPASQE